MSHQEDTTKERKATPHINRCERDTIERFSRLCQKSRKKVIKKAWNYRIHADIFCANYVVY